MLKIRYTFLLFISLSLTASEQAEQKYEVSEKVALQIKNINQDGGKLYYYFKGVFEAMGKQNRLTMPSEILSFFASEMSGINTATQLVHMPATKYINLIIKPHCQKFDEAFAKKLAAEKNNQKAWAWFDKHFKEHGLIKPFKAYKLDLIQKDQLARVGIAISPDGSTFIIRGCQIGMTL